MEQNTFPVLFDETKFTIDEIAYLAQEERNIKKETMQARLEVGCILKRVRQWFSDHHKWGYMEWVQARFGFSVQTASNLIDDYEHSLDSKSILNPGTSPTASRELRHAPNPQRAIDEATIRKQIEGELTVRMTKQIADFQRAEKIARDEAKSNQERADALDRQLTYIKQQLEQVKKTASQPQKSIEKIVEKRVEVVPQHVMDRQKDLETRLRELQTQKANLQAQSEQIKKERDLYKRDLDKERQDSNALFLQNLEANGSARLRANFAEIMREIVAWSSASRMKLPSVVDTQVFEMEEWQRLEEALQAHTILGDELRKIKNTVSSPAQQQSFIIDSEVIDSSMMVR